MSSLVQVDNIFLLYDGASGAKDGVIDFDEFQKVPWFPRQGQRSGREGGKREKIFVQRW